MCSCGAWHTRRCGLRTKFSVSKPPRVHQVALAIGFPSQYVLEYILYKYGISGIYMTPSHCVPLPIAIRIVNDRYCFTGPIFSK